MQLTDEQYNQIARYVEGQMDEEERIAFDAARAANDELNDEIAFYREFQSLAQSIDDKFNSQALNTNQQNNGVGDELSAKRQARQNWEQNNEGDLKSKLGISTNETQNIKKDKENISKPNTKKDGKVEKINDVKRLIAAAILCVLLLSVFYIWRSKLSKTNVDVAKAIDGGTALPIIANNKTNLQIPKMPPVVSETISLKKVTGVGSLVTAKNSKLKPLLAPRIQTVKAKSFKKDSISIKNTVVQNTEPLPDNDSKNLKQSVVRADTNLFFTTNDSLYNPRYLSIKKENEKLMYEIALAKQKAESEIKADNKPQMIRNEQARTESRKELYKIDTAKQTALFVAYFTPDKIPIQTASRLKQAIVYYKNSDYKNAVLAFNNSSKFITRGFEENGTLMEFYTKYYSGLSYLAMDSAKNAIENLEDATVTSPSNILKIKTHWYLALAFLKGRNITATKQVLAMIINNEDDANLKQQAKALLNQLQ